MDFRAYSYLIDSIAGHGYRATLKSHLHKTAAIYAGQTATAPMIRSMHIAQDCFQQELGRCCGFVQIQPPSFEFPFLSSNGNMALLQAGQLRA